MSYEGLNHYLGEEDYYGTLGIDPGASAAEIKLAFQKHSVKCEVASANSKRRELAAQTLARVTRAYELLSSPARRARYDRFVFNDTLPENPRVARFYHEGLRFYRNGEFDKAINRLLEAVRLHPHRNLYRIHLAMAYAERGWKQYAVEELNRAIAINPEDFFAQEALMNLETMKTARRSTIEFTPLFKKQVAGVAAAFVLIMFTVINGAPQRAASALTGAQQQFKQTVHQAQEAVMTQRGSRTIDSNDPYAGRRSGANSLSPEQPRQTIGGAPAGGSVTPLQPVQPAAAGVTIGRLTADQLPPSAQDYTKLRATKKTYYPQDNVVVVIYEDGAVMTYRPDDLSGWYADEQNGLAVMVTRDREVIPAPMNMALQMPDGSRADMSAPGFPAHLFPEYSGTTASSSSVRGM